MNRLAPAVWCLVLVSACASPASQEALFADSADATADDADITTAGTDAADTADTATPGTDAADAADTPDAQDADVAIPCVPTDCNDANPCTDDKCVAGTGCTHTNNTATCDDGKACTSGDTCTEGSCLGATETCSDGDDCTIDSCDGKGGCVFTPTKGACSTGDLCVTGATCQSGTCAGGQAANCDDNNGCTTDSCVSATGCKHVNIAKSCDDGNVCTSGDTCSGGTCVGATSANCDDGNQCTTDSCLPASGCSNSNNAIACDDGNACSANDTCAGGTCKGTGGPNCDDNNPCTVDGCDTNGGCKHTAIGDGTVCTAASCSSGVWQGASKCTGTVCGTAPTSIPCDDGNACTADSCNATQGCLHASLSTGSCDDGNKCTDTDTCASGVCAGVKISCDDGKLCTDDACDPDKGCTHSDNNNVCNDSNPCTKNDACSAGTCAGGTPVVCTAIDQCHSAGTCDTGSGICSNPAITDGSACNDGNVCTVDGCDSNGACTHAGCSDGDVCTADVCVTGTGCVYPSLGAQMAYVKASNTASNTIFGRAVAIDGDTMVMGAAQESGASSGVNGSQADGGVASASSGAAYVFMRQKGAWTQQAYLKASNASPGGHFGLSVALSGDTIVVGAYAESSNAVGVNGDQSNKSSSASGAAYVFVRSGTTWTQQAYLKASNTHVNDSFGYAVAIAGDTIVVGAANESSSATGVNGNQTDTSAQGNGAAYVFTRTGSSWSQQAYLKSSHFDPGGIGFGGAVAVSGDTIVVGASAETSGATGINGDPADTSASDSGAAYVFTRTGTTWSQQAYLKASNTGTYDEFGGTVGISGDTIIVGAAHESSKATGVNGEQSDNSLAQSGAAYVFVRQNALWTQQAYLKASNTGAGDQFGAAVVASGDTLVVGAQTEASNASGINGNQADNSLPNSGAAYVFSRSAGTWSQQAYLKASNTDVGDQFGWPVAASGDTVIVGAYQERSSATGINGNQADNSAPGAGAAYVFEFNQGCDDKNPCTNDSCSANACIHTNNTGPCADGDACTAPDVCANGSCGGGAAVTCTGDACHLAGVCDAVTGCSHPAKSDGTKCSANACMQGESCTGGNCGGGTTVVCTGGPLCHNNCDPSTGCTTAASPDGTGCDDGSQCTSNDICTGGACAGTAKSCDDSSPCTTDACDAATGACVNTPCTDNNACTVDVCVTGTGCVFDAVGAQMAKFKDPTAWGFTSAAMDGDTLVAGVGEYGAVTSFGAYGNNAVVFVRKNGQWAQQAVLSVAVNASNFGMSVAISGDTIVVGASQASLNKGAAYVFVRQNGVWSQQAAVTASNAFGNAYFGGSVAISGDTMVVGAYGEDSNARGVNGDQTDHSMVQAGAAYVFERVGTTWSQQAYLKATNTDQGDLFGSSVGISGDTIVVGAPGESGDGPGPGGVPMGTNKNGDGAAYVFARSGSTWSLQAYLKASNADSADAFGTAVAISTDTIVVSAIGEASDATGINGDQSDNSKYATGAAYVFARTDGRWSQQAYLKASNADTGAKFGYSVAIANDTVVVGAVRESSNATGVNGVQTATLWTSGAAYVFQRSGSGWSQAAYLKASNPLEDVPFGCGVAVSGDTVVVDSPHGLGGAYFFELNQGCDDNNACTLDACTANACTHTPVSCDANAQCGATTGCVCNPGFYGTGDVCSCGGTVESITTAAGSESVCAYDWPVWGNRSEFPANYFDTGDGTVNDWQTRLMWQQTVVAPASTWTDAKTYCDGLTLAGHDDWRLPTVAEAESLIDYGKHQTPLIATVFAAPGITLGNLWASVADVDTSGGQKYWYAGLVTGTLDATSAFQARCVRTTASLPAPTTRFTAGGGGSGTVTDNATGLIWQQSVASTTFNFDASGNGAAGSAQAYCAAFAAGNYASGWRLPNERELLSLVDRTAHSPAINAAVFPSTPVGFFWSSTVANYLTGQAFSDYTTNGGGQTNPISASFSVRCVHD